MRISTRIRMLLKSRRLRRRTRVAVGVRRRGTWLVVAALAGIGLAATVDALRGEKEAVPPDARQAVTGAEENTAEEAPAAPTPASVGPPERPRIARLSRIVEGVSFSFRVPTYGWEPFSSIPTAKSPGGPISINKSIVGPQGAEAIIYWTSFPDGDYADPCTRLLSASVGHSAADLAAAVSTAPGTELVTGPSDVAVGGRPAKHVVLSVRENVGCDPGFFYTWRDVEGGALWPTTSVGDTIRVWIVDVDGTRLFIAAETTEQATTWLKKEIQQIIQSIRFSSSPDAAKQRVAITTKGVSNAPVSAEFVLAPLQAGALDRDSGTTGAGSLPRERVVMREGQRVEIYDPIVETFNGKWGTLVIRSRVEYVDAGNGYHVGTGTWKVVRGTGQYAQIAGGGRRGDVWLDRGLWSGHNEGVLIESGGEAGMLDADPASKSCGDFPSSGDYPAIEVEVVEGNVPCRVARRVLNAHYYGRDTGSWNCHGPEGFSECETNLAASGKAIRGRFYCRDWEADRARCLDTFGPP